MKILDENGDVFAWRLTEKNIHEIKAYLDAGLKTCAWVLRPISR